MNGVAFLLGLLLVAYVGSQLMGGRAGLRLASGAEYLLLGLALGPYALGAVDRATLQAFEPVSVVGSAWFALVVGSAYGFHDRGRVRFRGVAAGIVLASLTTVVAGAAAYFIGSRLTALHGRELWLVACGSGLVGAETTRHAMRWAGRDAAKDARLARLVADIAESDDIVPIVAMAMVLPAIEPPAVNVHVPFWVWGAGTLAVGVVLGAIAAALLRSELTASDGWGVIIGALLLATGISWRLGLSPVSSTFALGVSLSLFSRHSKELRHMIGRSEHAVLLPTLLLAGADVEVPRLKMVVAVLAAVFVARGAVRLLVSPALTALARAPAAAAPSLGMGLLTSGALSIVLGMAFATRFPGLVGDVVLAVAVGLAVLGELTGPRSLRRALVIAGELEASRADGRTPPRLDEPAAEARP